MNARASAPTEAVNSARIAGPCRCPEMQKSGRSDTVCPTTAQDPVTNESGGAIAISSRAESRHIRICPVAYPPPSVVALSSKSFTSVSSAAARTQHRVRNSREDSTEESTPNPAIENVVTVPRELPRAGKNVFAVEGDTMFVRRGGS